MLSIPQPYVNQSKTQMGKFKNSGNPINKEMKAHGQLNFGLPIIQSCIEQSKPLQTNKTTKEAPWIADSK